MNIFRRFFVLHTYIKKGHSGKPYKQNEEAFAIIRKRSKKTGKKEITDVQAFKDSPQNEHVWFGQLFNENGTITERNIIDKQHFVFDIEAKSGKLEFDRSELDLLNEQLERFGFHYILVHSHGSNMKENKLKVHIFIETKDPIPADQYEVLYETFRRTYLPQTDSGFFDSRMKLVAQTVSLPRYNPSMHNDPEIPFFVEKNKGKPFDHTTLLDTDIFKSVHTTITRTKEFEAEQAKKATANFKTQLEEDQIIEWFDRWINQEGMRERLALSGGIGEKAMIQIKAWKYADFINKETAENFMIELANGNSHFEERNLRELEYNKKLPKKPEPPEQFLKVNEPRPLPEEPQGYTREEFDPFIAEQTPVNQNGANATTRAEKPNPFLVIEQYGEVVGFDEYTQQFIFLDDPAKIGVSKKVGDKLDVKPRSIDIAEIRQKIALDYGAMMSIDDTLTAVQGVYRKNSFDSLTNYLTLDENGNPLEYDPETEPDYLGDLVVNCLGAEDTPLNREISRRFMVNAVNRGINGKYHDVTYKFVPCFIGAQDIGKSKLLAKIGGAFFDEVGEMKTSDARFINTMMDTWLIELGETGFFTKNGDDAIKQIITKKHMKSPRFGGVGETDKPLRCVFANTSNHEGFSLDEEGKRYYPIKCGVSKDIKECSRTIDKLTEKDIKRLFAQAIYLMNQGGEFWEIDESLQEEMTDQRSLVLKSNEVDEYVQLYTSAEFPLDTYCHGVGIDGDTTPSFHIDDAIQILNNQELEFDLEEFFAEWGKDFRGESQWYRSQLATFERTKKARSLTVKKARVQKIHFDDLERVISIMNPDLRTDPYFTHKLQKALKKCGFTQARPTAKGKDKRIVGNYGDKLAPSKIWERSRKTAIEKSGSLKFINPSPRLKTWGDILETADQMK